MCLINNKNPELLLILFRSVIMKMKKRRIILLLLSALIAVLPVYFLFEHYNKIHMHYNLSHNVRYVDNLNVSIYEFPNRDCAEKTLKEIKGINQFEEISIIPKRPTLVQGFVCEEEPEIEYIKSGTYRGIDKYWASITNDDTSKSFSFSTYQLSKYLIEMGIVNLLEGKMLDFNKQDKECIEILVTDGFGAEINDEIYFTVNGLDKEYKQVVVKAKVIGIVGKGSFLYGCADYCGAVRMTENLYESIFEDEMVFTNDISYLYEYEGEPNSLLDEEIPVFLLGKQKGTGDSSVDTLVSANGGEKVVRNVNEITVEGFESDVQLSYSVFAVCVLAIVIIIIVDIVLIKKTQKKDE